MSERNGAEPQASDATLVERTREGDQRAFAELWHRHYRSGVRVARQFTSSLDADDLVSEAFTRIYKRVLAGGGPTGAFRPYLYTTIRNLASTWGAASHDVQVDDLADFSDPSTLDDPAAVALDRTLTARAFRTLPERWQSVLWYTEVEGLDPHEVAPLLGMSANGVAALSYRAREGLRKAWLQAHISDATASGECQWAIAHVGDNARHSLTPRDTERMSFHLSNCSKCAIISEEVEEVGSRLALVLWPALLGGVAGGGIIASFGTPSSSAMASDLIPALPEAVTAGATAAAGITAAATITAPAALVGSLAVAVAVTGGFAVMSPTIATEFTDQTVVASPLDPTDTPSAGDSTPEGRDALAGDVDHGASIGSGEGSDGPSIPGIGPDKPGNIPSAHPSSIPIVEDLPIVPEVIEALPPVVEEVVDDVDDIVGAVVDDISGDDVAPEGHTAPGGVVGTDISLNLSGTGTPGAHVSLQAAGQVYATTTVDANGNFTLAATAIPGGLSSLELVQAVDRTYLSSLVGGGLLGGVLGKVDDLVNALIKPITLSSNDSSIAITLLG